MWQFPMHENKEELVAYNYAMEGMRKTFSQRVPPPTFATNELFLDDSHPRVRLPPMLNNFGSFEYMALQFRADQGDILFAAMANPLTRPQLLSQAFRNPELAQKIQSLGFRLGPSQRI